MMLSQYPNSRPKEKGQTVEMVTMEKEMEDQSKGLEGEKEETKILETSNPPTPPKIQIIHKMMT